MHILQYALSSVQTYFHLPVDEDDEYDTVVPLPRSTSSPELFSAWARAKPPPSPNGASAATSSSSASLSSSISTLYSSRTEPSSSANSPVTSPVTSPQSSRPSSPPLPPHHPPSSPTTSPAGPASAKDSVVIGQILSETNLYQILGVSRTQHLTKTALRRAYLSRSRDCHPDKFGNDPEATLAFQKVSVAYDILSNPSSRRLYDTRPSYSPFSPSNRQSGVPGQAQAEETFRNVLLGVLNDFLDGDLEMVRTLLRAMSDTNPNLRLGEDVIDGIIGTVQAIRDRAITCRTCIIALHAELTRLLELQQEWTQLPFFDVRSRSRITLQLARVTLNLPVAVEQALIRDGDRFFAPVDANDGEDDGQGRVLVPQRIGALIRALSTVLERMESML